MQNIQLRNLPAYAKLFAALFTTLMLCVCFWAIGIYYIAKGFPDDDTLPTDETQQELLREDDAGRLASDSISKLAPIWDSEFAGREVTVDSVSNLEYFQRRDKEMANDALRGRDEPDLDRNMRLAHTHINGQTLLFFAIGLVFVSTSVNPRTKKIVIWIFFVSAVAHAVGLTGENYHWLFNDILAVSGVAILVSILYMAFMIYIDLAKKPESNQ